MCGILGLVRERGGIASTTPLVEATSVVRHRGPDDEGYLLWAPGGAATCFAGADTSAASREMHALAPLPPLADWRVALGHRRLSIVDLSPAGHQPMVHRPTGMTVAYNGEIYNHIELRRELESLGHHFTSHCDSEVLLAAFAEWGPACADRFNGMFAFALLDPRDGGRLHVMRDRFGVKPLYWARIGGLLGFASEIKQLRSLPGFVPRLDERAAFDYLSGGLVDHTRNTFDESIQQLLGGERAVVELGVPDAPMRVERWYTLRPRPFAGGAEAAAAELQRLLADSVKLRLRADVPLGSCLSGGLDSSAIVCLAKRALLDESSHAGQVTVTARYAEAKYDEWQFAVQIVDDVGARSVEVWPSVERLRAELDDLVWHMDDPFGSTSQFSQWCVFAAAADAGLTVMLDGQGSDEQLAGYTGNDAALFAGMMRRGALAPLARELLSFRRKHGRLPIAQVILALRNVLPAIDAVLPARVRVAPETPAWLKLSRPPGGASVEAPRDLRSGLRAQTLSTSLPALLRYEDRTSMARSVESRVPFLDYRLVEFVAGLPDQLKLARGTTKVVLREALRGVVPEPVRDRRDKMGFVTPEQRWLTESATEWFREGIEEAIAAAPHVFDGPALRAAVESMIAGRTPFNFMPWRVICFGRWIRAAQRGRSDVAGRAPAIDADARVAPIAS